MRCLRGCWGEVRRTERAPASPQQSRRRLDDDGVSAGRAATAGRLRALGGSQHVTDASGWRGATDAEPPYAQIILDPGQVLVPVPLLQRGLRLLATRPRTSNTPIDRLPSQLSARPDLTAAADAISLSASATAPRNTHDQRSPSRLGTHKKVQARRGEQKARTRVADAPHIHRPLPGLAFHTRARQAGRRTPVSLPGSPREQGSQLDSTAFDSPRWTARPRSVVDVAGPSHTYLPYIHRCPKHHPAPEQGDVRTTDRHEVVGR